MKNQLKSLIKISLIAVLAACGSPSEIEYGLDQDLRQYDPDQYDPELDNPDIEFADPAYDPNDVDKLYIEGNYGWEGNQTKCSPPWSNSICAVPDFRTFSIGVHQYSCSDTIFKNQILDAANHARDVANANGWNVFAINVYTVPPSTPGGYDIANPFDIYCTTSAAEVPAGKMARTNCSENIDNLWDCHDTQFGRLCQFKNCVISVGVNNIKNTEAWKASSTTNTQRGIGAENVCRHEFGHVLGFGHGPNDTLMESSFPEFLPLAPEWTGLKTWTNTEKHQLDCYKETSGTSPNC